MKPKTKIKPKNYGWFLLKLKPECHLFSSHYCIAQYLHGLFFEDQSNETISEDDTDFIVLKLKDV